MGSALRRRRGMGEESAPAAEGAQQPPEAVCWELGWEAGKEGGEEGVPEYAEVSTLLDFQCLCWGAHLPVLQPGSVCLCRAGGFFDAGRVRVALGGAPPWDKSMGCAQDRRGLCQF